MIISRLMLVLTSVYFASHTIAKEEVVGHLPANKVVSAIANPDIATLEFNELYKMPIGPAGLEFSEKLLNLQNKRVRINGFMAHEDDPTPGIFMLAPRPVNVGEKADGMADDLPANTIFVHMPAQDNHKILNFRPGRWSITGRLEIGNKEESSGRVSTVRIIMSGDDRKNTQAVSTR